MANGPHRFRIGQRINLIALCVLSAAAVADKVHAGNYFSGETVYQKYCQSCHGNRGQGMIGGAPNFARGQGLMKPDAGLYDIIYRGKNAMPAFRGVLKEEEFYDVIAYIRSFYR